MSPISPGFSLSKGRSTVSFYPRTSLFRPFLQPRGAAPTFSSQVSLLAHLSRGRLCRVLDLRRFLGRGTSAQPSLWTTTIEILRRHPSDRTVESGPLSAPPVGSRPARAAAARRRPTSGASRPRTRPPSTGSSVSPVQGSRARLPDVNGQGVRRGHAGTRPSSRPSDLGDLGLGEGPGVYGHPPVVGR